MKDALRRLPWWGVGLLAAVLAYAALRAGLLLANAVTDPACGLIGVPEMVVGVAAAVGHPWLGLVVAFLLARPERAVKAFLLGIVVAAVALAVNLSGVGPELAPEPRCGTEGGFRVLGGLVVTGLAAALLALRRG